MSHKKSTSTKAVQLSLCLLLLLFALRIGAQFLVEVFGVPLPMPQGSWDSGLVSYKGLLSIQLLIFILFGFLVSQVTKARPVFGFIAGSLGVMYFATMLVRLIVGISGTSMHHWFDKPLPTSFHFVLAGFLLIWGGAVYFREKPNSPIRFTRFMQVFLYPGILTFGLALFAWFLQNGFSPDFATYHTIVLGTFAIVIAELLMPYRRAWGSNIKETKTDILYLGIVQIIVPALAMGGFIFLIRYFDFSLTNFWPSDWPIAVQVILMLVVSDFFRYWLHVYSHKLPPLWQLHAVHHSPEELHALNVGRFHPLEKILQFIFDTAPFLLLGVSDIVTAGYLVFYALNGFFQHSNVDVKLGFLNWIISGPELHRWHHARIPKISDHNFGNNLIIWDAIFGTRYLPKGEEVGELGVLNKEYPQDIWSQTLIPNPYPKKNSK